MPLPLTTKIQGSDVQLAEGQPGSLTFMPRNFAELDVFADRMAASRFVPGHLRGKPGDCFAVALQALRWGMDPFAVANQTYFAKEGGAPAYMAQLVNAVVHARAPLEGRLKITFAGDWPNRTCTVSGKLRGDDDIKARTVHAVNITVRNSPLWKSDPDQQLGYYSQRAWAKLFVPDVLMGIYTPDDEEMHAERARDITPQEERPQPTSRLDALEEIIDAGGMPGQSPRTMTEITEPDRTSWRNDAVPIGLGLQSGVVEGVTTQVPGEHHDPETGEVTEPDIFPPHEPPQPSALEVATIEDWAQKKIKQFDTVTEASFIDDWLESSKDALARARGINPDAAMAVVEAADARKKKIEQEKFTNGR